MHAIEAVESNHGANCGVGGSGEVGCLQIMPDTWKAYSNKVLGYVARASKVNEEYVSAVIMQGWLERGEDIHTIALIWNQGHKGICSKGTNKYGVKYDSCNYKMAVLNNY